MQNLIPSLRAADNAKKCGWLATLICWRIHSQRSAYGSCALIFTAGNLGIVRLNKY